MTTTDEKEQSSEESTPTDASGPTPTLGDGRHLGDGGCIGVPRPTEAPTSATAWDAFVWDSDAVTWG